MTGSSQLVALALAGLSLTSACTSVCDEHGLQRAAQAFTAGGSQREAGLTALQEACPTLPPALAQSLAADALTPDAAARLRAGRTEDPGWRTLLARTCQPMTPPSRPIVLEELEQDVRRRCDLDRHGLLVPEATFTRQDIVVFMLYEWLPGASTGPAPRRSRCRC